MILFTNLKDINLFICRILTMVIIAGGCTAYYTKEFHFKEILDEHLKANDNTFGMIDTLEGRFEDWQIAIGIWSVYEEPDRRKIDSNLYYIKLGFRHKIDSLTNSRIGIQLPSDTIKDIITIDSVSIIFFPSGKNNVLLDSTLTLNQRDAWRSKRSLYFNRAFIPPDIDSINVAFEVRLIGRDGKEKANRHYSFNMIKYVDKFRSIPPGWFR